VIDANSLTIRSFRVVFDLERRIHRVDRWRLPVPHGIPLRGIAYFAAALAFILAMAGVPVVGALLATLPAPLRLVVVPVGFAYLLTQVKVDGRPAHRVVAGWGRLQLEPSKLASFRTALACGSVARLGDVTVAPDASSARYRRAVVDGPAEVLLRYPPHGRLTRSRHRDVLHVTQLAGPPLVEAHVIQLQPHQRLVLGG